MYASWFWQSNLTYMTYPRIMAVAPKEHVLSQAVGRREGSVDLPAISTICSDECAPLEAVARTVHESYVKCTLDWYSPSGKL